MLPGAAVSCAHLTEQSRAQKEAGSTLLTYEFTGVSNTMAKRERVGCGWGMGSAPALGERVLAGAHSKSVQHL